MRRIPWAAMTILCMGGCREVSYPPPPQRAEVPHEVKAILDMTGGRPQEAWGSIVSGVAQGDPSMEWRWTMAHPTFRFVLDSSATWKLNVRITAVATVLAKVGAQHVTFNVNGKPWASRLSTVPGCTISLFRSIRQFWGSLNPRL